MNLLYIIGFDRHFCLCNFETQTQSEKQKQDLWWVLFDLKN